MHKKHKRLLIGLGVVILTLGILYSIAVRKSQTKLRQAYAALENDGRPMKPGEVIPEEIPDAQNAITLYQEAARLLREHSAPRKSLLEFLGNHSYRLLNGSLSPEDRDEFERIIGQQVVTSALEIVKQGMQRPVCRLPRDYITDPFEEMPIITDLRRLGNILGAQAYIAAKAGESKKAWEIIRTQLQLTAALRRDPTVTGCLGHVSMIESACQAIKRVCEITPLLEGAAQVLETLTNDLSDTTTLARMLDGERLLRGEWYFKQPEDQAYVVWRRIAAGMDSRLAFRIVTFKPRFIAAHAAYLKVMHQCAQLSQEALLPLDVSNRKQIEDLRSQYMLTSELAQMAVFCLDRYSKTILDVNLTRAGLALLDYRQAKGAFPATLNALGMSDFIDPFTRQSLLYRPDGNGFVIYSVGEDLKDNGGKPKQSRQKTDYDIVWQFPQAI